MYTRICAIFIALGLTALAVVAADLDLNNAAWTLMLGNALDGKAVTLVVTTRYGRFTSAAVTAPPKTTATLAPTVPTLDDKHLRGDLTLRLNDKPVTFSLDATVADNAVTGTYTGVVGDAKANGAITGTVAAIRENSNISLVTASFFGTAGDDDIQGGGAAPDGTIYLVGNSSESIMAVPGGVAATRLGTDIAEPRSGHGFVVHLSADGSKVLAYTEFGAGILSLTSVQANKQGVYISGYATDGLEPLLKNVPGLIRDYPLRKQVQLLADGKWVEAVGDNLTNTDPIPEKKSGQLGRYGAPCVLRLPADLSKVECGTYLEGWQQVWSKGRQVTKVNKSAILITEYSWQPTHLGLLRSDDVMVCHDGGYFRLLTDEDRQFAAKNAERLADENPNPAPAKAGDPVPDRATRVETYRVEMLRRLGFYDVCDHLSRLTPDLAKRAYHQPIYTPATDLATVKELKGGFPHPYYSNPRTLRMRLDKDDNLFICGWSASATSREPYWCAYIWKMNTADGSLIQKIEEPDPMGGADHRMNGAVADRGIGSIAIDGDDILSSSMSDGGYSGVIHFSGSITRRNMQTKETKGTTKTAPCFWTTDMAMLQQSYLLAIGRSNYTAQETPDAWQKAIVEENPTAWLRVYGPKLETVFSTAIRGVVPYALVPLSETSFLLVGKSKGTLNEFRVGGTDKPWTQVDDPNPGAAVIKDALFNKSLGKDDGYFMIVNTKAPEKGL